MSSEFTSADLARIQLERDKRKLDLYRPYLKQQMFHRNAGKYRETLLRAGNQCQLFSSYIDCPDSKSRLFGSIFCDSGSSVLAWDGEKECIGHIERGHLKGIESAFRVVLDNGHFFDCPSNHEFLSEEGYISLNSLCARAGGHIEWQKAEDYEENCRSFGYFYDGLLPFWLGSDRLSSPSRDGVQKHNLCWSLEDAMERIPKYIQSRLDSDHLPIFASEVRSFLGLFSQFPISYVPQPALPLWYDSLKFQQLSSELTSLLQLGASVLHGQDFLLYQMKLERYFLSGNMIEPCFLEPQAYQPLLYDEFLVHSTQSVVDGIAQVAIFFPYSHIPLVGGRRIIAVVPLGFQPIIDCQIPDVNNYKCAGVYHHNCGKTLSAAANTAIHATGKYPDSWWEGVRLTKAPVIWCAGVTGEVVRDSIQKLLIGDGANPGTGFIPADDIIEMTPSRGVADLIDTIYVKHVSGGKTRIRLKYYEQGREKFQADTINIGWLDEEPPLDIYTEMLTRTNATKGFIYMTFTPLKGMSEVVRKFLHEKSPDRCDINMTIEDALHIAPEERQKIINSYPVHERTARIMGQPILGSGRIFPIAEEDIACDPFDMASVPFFWQEIAGIDFGWDHPTAAVKILYNPQDDIIYVTNTYKRSEQTPLIHAAALKPWGKTIPWAWPHDGLIHDKNSGEQLSVTYRELGMNMMSEHATFENGSNSVEAGLTDMLMRMQTGRFKVFRHLFDFFEEFRLYHRKDGKVQKEYDDILCAVRYSIMMLRNAARVRKVGGMMINGYPIEEESRNQGNHQVNYNPLSREICRNVTRK